MAPLRGWAPKGKRLMAKAPFGHWNTMTFVAALRHDRIEAPWLLDGPMNGERFRIYIEKVLVPTLLPGDVVIMDNLGSHKGQPVRRAIRQAGTGDGLPQLRQTQRIAQVDRTWCGGRDARATRRLGLARSGQDDDNAAPIQCHDNIAPARFRPLTFRDTNAHMHDDVPLWQPRWRRPKHARQGRPQGLRWQGEALGRYAQIREQRRLIVSNVAFRQHPRP
jgi:hypothetical protein